MRNQIKSISVRENLINDFLKINFFCRSQSFFLPLNTSLRSDKSRITHTIQGKTIKETYRHSDGQTHKQTQPQQRTNIIMGSEGRGVVRSFNSLHQSLPTSYLKPSSSTSKTCHPYVINRISTCIMSSICIINASHLFQQKISAIAVFSST